jgi:hypothetical protein
LLNRLRMTRFGDAENVAMFHAERLSMNSARRFCVIRRR